MFILSRAAKKLMRDQGSIILFSSMYGSVAPYPDVYFPPMEVNPLAYGMCKAAINQMTKYLAVTWGPENIRVNAVAPGPFPNLDLPANDKDFIKRLAQKTPLKRVGRQEEIAGTVIYLLSPESSYVTGQKYSCQRRLEYLVAGMYIKGERNIYPDFYYADTKCSLNTLIKRPFY